MSILIDDVTPQIQYTATGGQTVFPYPFVILDDDDIVVTQNGTTLVKTTNYTVSGVGVETGGNITLVVGATNGDTIVLYRDMPLERQTDYLPSGDFFADVLDTELNRLVMMIQQLARDTLRALRVPFGETADAIPTAEDRANKVLGFDSSGVPTVITPADSPPSSLGIALASSIGASLIGFLQAGVGAVVRTIQSVLRERISITDFAANGVSGAAVDPTGVIDSILGIRAAVVVAVANGYMLRGPAGTFLISGAIERLTNDLYATRPSNGLVFICDGSGRTIFKATPAFAAPNGMFNMDGNAAGSTDNNNPRAQRGNYLKGFSLDGSSVAAKGIRIRANTEFRYDDIGGYNFAGSVSDAFIRIAGVTGAGLDDADTTFNGSFNAIHTSGTNGGYGFLGVDNRCGAIAITNSDLRNHAYDGIRLAFAGLTLDNVTVAGCGQFGANSGGIACVQSTTGARTRGLSARNCQLENNYWYDWNLEYIYGADISGFTIHPYQRQSAPYAQKVFDIGAVDAQNINIHGGRIQEYSTNGWLTTLFNLRSGAKSVEFKNVSHAATTNTWALNTVYALGKQVTPTALNGFRYEATTAGTSAGTEPVWPLAVGATVADGTVVWTAKAHYFEVDAAAENITKDGHAISHAAIKPSFFVWGTTNAAAAATLVNGTEFKTNDYFNAAGVTVDHNNGSHLDVSGTAAGGIFLVPHNGFYEFGIKFSVRGLDASNRRLLTVIKRLRSGATVDFVVNDTPLVAQPATDTWMVGGSIQLKLNKGDKISAGITMSGGTGNALIDRVLAGAFSFMGRAF